MGHYGAFTESLFSAPKGAVPRALEAFRGAREAVWNDLGTTSCAIEDLGYLLFIASPEEAAFFWPSIFVFSSYLASYADPPPVFH